VRKEASRIIYGTLFLHLLPTEEEVHKLLDSVWATGCNTFDCAAIYGGGLCEERMGRWLMARQLCTGRAREDLVLITKGGCETQEKLWACTISDQPRVRSELERSLRRLGVAYLDVYLLHRDDPMEPVERIADFMSALVDEGLIHGWGVSNWQLHRLGAALEYARRSGKHAPIADSPQNSLAEPSRAVWPNTSFMSAETRPAWAKVTRGQVAMLGWECLAKGFMCGKWTPEDDQGLVEISLGKDNVAEWREWQLRRAYCNGPLNFDRRDRAVALAAAKGVDLPVVALGYVLSQSPLSFALVGTTSTAHFEQNVRAASLSSPVARMSSAELRYLETGAPLPDMSSDSSAELRYLETGAPLLAQRSPASLAPSRARAMGALGAVVGCWSAALLVAAMGAVAGTNPSLHSVQASSGRTDPADGSLRFDGGSTDAGRVQFFRRGVWGTVCAHEADARRVSAVACRQLGFGAATGTMRMPSASDGPMWLRGLRCVGTETRLAECEHGGVGGEGEAVGSHYSVAPCTEALGVRCLACIEEACEVYTVPVTLRGALEAAAQVAPAYYNASRALLDFGVVLMAQALLLECAKREGSSSRVSPVDCHVSTYDEAVYMTSTYVVRTDGVSPYDETEPRQPSGADAACAAPTAQRADETDADETDETLETQGDETDETDETLETQGDETDETDKTDDDDDSVLAGLPDPFRPEVARRAYVFSEGLQAEYRARRRALIRYLRAHEADAAALRRLVGEGVLQWNDAGIMRRPLLSALNASCREIGLLRLLYLSPRVNIVWDLDKAVGEPKAIEALEADDPAAAAIARGLQQEGLATIDDFGLDINAIEEAVDAALAQPDPAVTSVASNGASMATRVYLPALAPLLSNSTILKAVRAYLGPDAALDGYKAVRLAPNASGAQNIAGLWHNDRAGNRLKIFVRLHAVDPRPEAGGHPTLVAAGSHGLLHYSFEGYEHSRYTDGFVRSEYTVAFLGGPRGSGFVFDTNTLHRGVPEGLIARTTLVLEYHAAAKCPVIQTLDLPIPCPSGDQRLLSRRESQLTILEKPAAAPSSSPTVVSAAGHTTTTMETATMVPGAGNQCVAWTALPYEMTPGLTIVRSVDDPGLAIVRSADDPDDQLQLKPLGSWVGTGLALSARIGCTVQWRFYSFDVMPMDGNTVWLDTVPNAPSGRQGICLLDNALGRVPFGGEHAGGCLVPGALTAAFGGFHMLLAFRTPSASEPSSSETRAEASAAASLATDAEAEAAAAAARVAPEVEVEVERLRALVLEHVSDDDAAMLKAVTRVSVADLVGRVVRAATEPIATMQGIVLIDAVLSAVRFVPHALNAAGLHLLRVLLAERMDDSRRRLASNWSAEAEALRPAWERDGVLLLDWAEYTSSRGTGNERLNEVLRMAAASSMPEHTLRFVPRAVRHVAGDPQYALHMDTFHSVVKIWVYPRNMSEAEGPLHVVRGSHRCSPAKLRWLYGRTQANAPDVLKEPSIRFDAASSTCTQAAAVLHAIGLPRATPILPLPDVEQTIVVADTSALHCRGEAPPHTLRTALRPMGTENDGGVRRLNPFRSI
jgi:aryl-alcohol dehydrogenase-like predicted oxidoreductase